MKQHEPRPSPIPLAWGLVPLSASGTTYQGRGMYPLYRRAVLGTLIRAGRAMSSIELTQEILASRPITIGEAPLDSSKVGEILRYQTRKGTVRRVSHGVYVFVPGSMARTTQWRCERWERWYDEEQDRHAEWAHARDSIDKVD